MGAPADVVVVGAEPARRAGLARAFDEVAGIEARAVPPWPDAPRPGALVVVLTGEGVGARTPWPVECLVVATALSSRAVRDALLAGAVGVVDDRAPWEDVVAQCLAAHRGEVRLPLGVVRGLAGGVEAAVDVTTEEVTWLHLLADGMRMSELARRCLVSERVMYRRLSELYDRLGVSGRSGAIALAARAGLIEIEPGST